MSLPSKLVLMVMAFLAVVILTESQQSIPTCASNLVPCYRFINSAAKPDATCCSSIKVAVANELPCVCTLYNTPGLLSSFNVSVDDALRITKDCNVSVDLSSCNVTAPSPGSVPPSPGSPANDNGAAGWLAWTGITSLLLFWAASLLLY